MNEQQSTEDTRLTQKEQRFQLNEVLASLKEINTAQLNENHKLKLQISLKFLAYILNNPRENYLSICSYFTENFLSIIIDINKTGPATAKIDDTFASLYRLAKEKYFRTDNLTENDRELLTFYDKYNNILTDTDLWHKFYSDSTLTKDYFKIDSTSIIFFKKEVQSHLEKSESQLQNVQNQTTTAKDELSKINEQIKQFKRELNFVGLSKAFTSILSSKTREKNLALAACILWAIIPLAIPLLLLASNITGLNIPDDYKDYFKIFEISNLAKITPFLTIEIIAIYYFRIIIQQFYNTKGQVLQLKLRAAICEFIQEYGVFLKENDFAEKHYFKQFEALIFSPIVPNPDQIPNTLDGIEQMGKIIKSCTGK